MDCETPLTRESSNHLFETLKAWEALLSTCKALLNKTVQHGSSASALFYPLIIWGCGSTRKAVLLEQHEHGAHLGLKMNRV